MRTFEVQRRSGIRFTVLVDDEDYDRVMNVGTWNLDQRGYVARARRGEQSLKLSRFILELTRDDPGVDHINGIKVDNQKHNLRVTSHLENGSNLDEISGRGSTPYRGVTFHRATGKWRAAQSVNRQLISLGLYFTQEAARDALRKFRDERGMNDRGERNEFSTST